MNRLPEARAFRANPLPVALAAAVIAFTVQMLWVRRFYVSMPYWDEWNSLYGFLETWRAGGVGWQAMFAQHMEHRVPVPRAFFIFVDVIFGEGNPLGLLTLHAVLMAGIVAIWIHTLRRLGEPVWLVAATLIVLLSPSQYENWLWSFQVEFFTLVGPVLAAVCWIALAPRITWTGVAGCALACAVSSYSLASGLSSWAAIGLLLFVRAGLDRGWSWRALLSARREIAQILAFLAPGVLITVTYFQNYVQLTPPEAKGRSLWQMAYWAAEALVFPLVNARFSADAGWLPAAIALVFLPIAAAMVMYARRGDHARLLLTAGLLLMVAGHVAIISYGRSGWTGVAPRYGTVFLWTSAISLMAMASLVRASRDRWRSAAIPIGLAVALLLGVHLWRYAQYLEVVRESRRGRLSWVHNVTSYLSDDSPHRQLPGDLPFPEAPIKPYLQRQAFLATLPSNLRPPARVTVSGDAWALDGVPPGAGLHGPFTWGSWTGSDAHTGTLTSTPFGAPRGLILAVSGYPTRPGNSLVVESVPDPAARLVYSGPDPGDRWIEWRVDRDRLPPGRLRVVAVDGRQADGAWVGIRFPEDKSAAARMLEAVVRHITTVSILLLAGIAGWSYWRPGRSPAPVERAVRRVDRPPVRADRGDADNHVVTPPPAPRPLGAGNALLVALAAGVVAFTIQMLWVRQYYVGVPYWDEWNGLYGILEAWHSGGLTWKVLFSQHMEHRVPVGRVSFILVDAIFGEGNMLGNLTMHALLMGGMVAIWAYTLRRLGEPVWLIAATIPVLLSPSQHENWLWGFQIFFYTLLVPVLAAVCWIALAARITWAGVAACALACAVSSYSVASGISSWIAIGVLLLFRTGLDRGSLRGLLGARREAAQLLVFAAAGVFMTAAYFTGYVQIHPPGSEMPNVAAIARWVGAALVFPLIDPLAAAEASWLPAAVVLVLGPIAAAMVLYARRGDRARLLLTAGVLLMVLGNVGIMAIGRSGSVFVASRYGTVLLWVSAVSLMSMASLARAPRGRWRAIAIPIGIAGAVLLGVHLWKYQRFIEPMAASRRVRLEWQHNLNTYFSDDSPDRQLPAVIPFPEAPIKPYLRRRQYLARLPYNLRPPARLVASGTAWSLDGVTSAAGVPGPFTWGSWNGADAHTGTLTSTPFALRDLTFAVSGYPTRPGNSLAIESTVDPTARVVYSGPDPGDRWTQWHVDRSRLPPGRIRVVAVDGRQADGAWVGIQFPVDKPVASRVLETVLRHLVPLSAAVLAIIGAWGYRRRRGARS